MFQFQNGKLFIDEKYAGNIVSMEFAEVRLTDAEALLYLAQCHRKMGNNYRYNGPMKGVDVQKRIELALAFERSSKGLQFNAIREGWGLERIEK